MKLNIITKGVAIVSMICIPVILDVQVFLAVIHNSPQLAVKNQARYSAYV